MTKSIFIDIGLILSFCFLLFVCSLLVYSNALKYNKECLRDIAENYCEKNNYTSSEHFFFNGFGSGQFMCEDSDLRTDDQGEWFNFLEEELKRCEK